MAPECDHARARSVEDVFLAPRRRSRPFTPPSLEDFVQELLKELESRPNFQASQAREERARQRATSIPEALDVGKAKEEEPKSSPISWFNPKEAHANEHEIMFFALLLICHAESVKELDDWAKKVVTVESAASELRETWKPREGEHGWPQRKGPGKISTLFDRMDAAYNYSWSPEALNNIGSVMQQWDGDGRFDGLQFAQLRNHTLRAKPGVLGVPDKPKGRAPPRWRTWAVVPAAEIVLKHGIALRKLLKLEKPIADVPTMAERAHAAEAHVDELQSQLTETREARDIAQNAYRKASVRNEEKMQVKRDAVKEVKAAEKRKREERLAEERVKLAAVREKAAAKAQGQVEAVRQRADARLEREVQRSERKVEGALQRIEQQREELVAKEAGLALDYEDRLAAARKSASKAHAEKRDAQGATEKVRRKLRRTERKLEKALESDDEMEVDEGDEMETDDEPDPVSRLPFEVLPRRDEKGRWQAESNELRALRHAQLGRGVASSKVAQNIADVISLLARDVEVPSPCERTMRRMRGEVTLTSEMMAAWKFASAKRIMCFGWDESTKFGNSVFACFAQVEYYDGTVEDICLRGLSILPGGGTSAAVLEHIETRILAHSRRMLGLWKEEFEQANGGAGSWAAAGGPDPENIGLHRLAEDTVLMSDTCNGARCTKRMLAEAIMKVVEERVGKEAWEAMSPEERDRRYKVYRGDCWQHLRNIIIGAMAETGNNLVREAVADSLDLFSSFERIDPSGSAVIRSAFKQFHHGGEYALGRGREFEVWRKLRFKSALFVSFERALGSRQDLAFDGCIPLFMNRVICLGFLRGYIDCPKSENVLDKSLYTLLRCNEFVALLRANALWKFIFSEPFRWLSGKTSKLEGMSIIKMGEVLEHVEKAMEEIAEDPAKALDESLDIFGPLAQEIPEFKDWRQELWDTKVKAEDGTEYYLVREVLRKARSPDPGTGEEQATALTLRILQAEARRALEKMHDPKLALADKLSSQEGANAFSTNHDAHERLKNVHGTNDGSENKFAIADWVMRTFRHMSVHNVAGVIAQRGAHDYDRPVKVVSDRRKQKAAAEAPEPKVVGGFFWRLSKELRNALMDAARHELDGALQTHRREVASHDEEKLARREEALTRQLNATVERYAAALELYDQWLTQGVRDRQGLEAALEGLSETQQIAELRRQIEMRTVGLGWREFEVKWGFYADERKHTIEKLTRMLLDDILPHELATRRLKQLPAEAAPPQLTTRVLKELGTADKDALALEATSLFNVASLLAKAEAERTRREAAGISDRVEAAQQKTAPPFDTRLVGKWLEVCWPYKENGKTVKIWASGRVVRVADGINDKSSARAKKIMPAGAILWAWEADPDRDEPAGEKWLVLLPKKWNKHVQYAWRYDPCELTPQGQARPPPRAPRIDPEMDQEEYLCKKDA